MDQLDVLLQVSDCLMRKELNRGRQYGYELSLSTASCDACDWFVELIF